LRFILQKVLGPFNCLFLSITDLFNLYLITKGNIAFKSPNLNAERSRTPIDPFGYARTSGATATLLGRSGV